MNIFCVEFCWTVKRYFPLSLSLIFLGFIVQEFKEIIPIFLESGHVTTIQYIITVVIFVFAILNIRKIKRLVKPGLTRKQKISFGIALYLILTLEAGANSLATNIFLLNLFAIAYMPENPIRDQLLIFSDYVWGLILIPITGWFIYKVISKYLTRKIEENKCSKMICWCTRNWIATTLFIIIMIDIKLIFST